MRVLVACECSGRVRDAFLERGHDAWSCDIYASEIPGPHLQCDVEQVLVDDWDLMIAHPPCTHLCSSGAKHFHSMEKKIAQVEALRFFRVLLEAPIERIAVENPVGVASTRLRKPDQIIQPYQFGDAERKTTCLWLKNLPPLVHTGLVAPKLIRTESGKMMPSWCSTRLSYRDARLRRDRSRTFIGIAKAMAQQWGDL